MLFKLKAFPNIFTMVLSYRFISMLVLVLVFSGCSNFRPKKAKEDLKIAFNTESANAEKYSKFAQVAIKEGFDTIAQLFDAVSKSESIHAANHGKILEKFGGDAGSAEVAGFEVKSTAENLKAAIKLETYDMQTMYPVFIRDGEQEKIPEIARSFTWAWNGEKKHFIYLRMAQVSQMKGKPTNRAYLWFVCPTCGNIYNSMDVKPMCDFCLTKQENFIGYRKATE